MIIIIRVIIYKKNNQCLLGTEEEYTLESIDRVLV